MYKSEDFKQSSLAFDPNHGEYLIRTSNPIYPWTTASGERFSDEQMTLNGCYPVFMDRISPGIAINKVVSWIQPLVIKLRKLNVRKK